MSKASRSLTIIADELKLASKKREIPKMLPVILVNNNSKEEKREQINLEWNLDLQRLLEDEIHKLRDNEKDVKIDICPVCQFRPKREKEERCNICEERRRGRLSEWFSNREETIWTDEVADENNRVALISLNFNLDRWLDGTMIGTIYSQSFEDWMDGEKENLNKAITGLKEELKKESKRINGMKKASDQSGIEGKVESKLKEQEELKERIKVLEFSLKQDKETIYRILDIFFDSKETNKKAAARILNTFFEENIGLNENTLDSHLDNISERIGILKEGLTKETLATYFFTQNPSPARLYRIWQETQEFFNLVIMEAKDKIYSNKWERIKFSVNDSTLISMLKPETPYIVQIDDLEPKGLLVFHNENGELYTIESLEKFKFKNEKGERKTGEEAVKEGLLKRGFKYLAPEDRPSKNLLKESQIIEPKDTITEEYYPFIKITSSPLSLRFIVPALDFVKITELIMKLYNKRFEKVIGKLPLNIKLLVAKRKFPLYILLGAENRMLAGEEFKKQVSMNPWWDINGMRNDEYYGFYPTEEIKERKRKENEKFTLDELSRLSKGKIFSLYPGYFDFELLFGTTDRYKISYSVDEENKKTKRMDGEYRLFSSRPHCFYQISTILEMWDVLCKNLSSSQINFIEEVLTDKLRKWRNIEDASKQNVFNEFTEATLKDAFGNNWNKLRNETRYFLLNSAISGLLFDVIALFRHIIKTKEADKNG